MKYKAAEWKKQKLCQIYTVSKFKIQMLRHFIFLSSAYDLAIIIILLILTKKSLQTTAQ